MTHSHTHYRRHCVFVQLVSSCSIVHILCVPWAVSPYAVGSNTPLPCVASGSRWCAARVLLLSAAQSLHCFEGMCPVCCQLEMIAVAAVLTCCVVSLLYAVASSWALWLSCAHRQHAAFACGVSGQPCRPCAQQGNAVNAAVAEGHILSRNNMQVPLLPTLPLPAWSLVGAAVCVFVSGTRTGHGSAFQQADSVFLHASCCPSVRKVVKSSGCRP